MLEEGLYEAACEQAGDAVFVFDAENACVLHANRWAEKLTGLKRGHCLSAFSLPSRESSIGRSESTIGLSWLDELVCHAARGRINRSCIVWDPPHHSRMKSKAFDVLAIRANRDSRPVVVVFIREQIRGKNIEQKLWQRNRELQSLNRAGEIMARSLNPMKVSQLALEVSMEMLKADGGQVFLADRDREILMKLSGQGTLEDYGITQSNRENHAMLIQSLRTGEPVLAVEGPRDKSGLPDRDSCLASIPLRSTDGVLGVLQLKGDNQLLTQNDLGLLSALGFQVGIALENAMLHKQVKETADFDGLTEVFNRQRMENLLDERIKSADRYGDRFSALMIDIDHFKSFNDAHSHEVGDLVLKKVAKTIMGEVRETDHMGRWGGEEFVLVLSESDSGQAVIAADRIRMRIAGMSLSDDYPMEVPVTVSIGVACYPDHAGNAEGLVRCADDAMRFAKRSGRNRTQLYSPRMADDSASPARHRIFRGAGLGTIRALAAALDAKDSYTAEHSQDVKELSISIAREMLIDRERVETLETAAILHDIGKVAVPDSILNKPGPLTSDEWAIIYQHPRLAVMILREAPQLSSVLPIVLHHHENYDGTGYPEGKSGNTIPLLSRILNIADSFSAMTTSRPYRKAMNDDAALEEIIKFKGTRYDPAAVDALIRVMAGSEDPAIA